MKINYSKNILFIVVILFTTLGYAQSPLEYKNGKVYLDYPTCNLPHDAEKSNLRIVRSQFTKDVIEGRLTPCSDIRVTYNGFPPNPTNPSQPGEAQVAFQAAVDIWASLIESSVPIRIEANFEDLDDGVLGNARTDGFVFNVPGFPANVVFPSALGEKLLNEDSDGPSGESNDIITNFSNTFPFHFDIDEAPESDEFDFITVVLHELGHGLGFFGFGREVDDINQGAIRNNGFVTIYDTLVNGTNASGNVISILDDTSSLNFPDPSSRLLVEFQTGSETIIINGQDTNIPTVPGTLTIGGNNAVTENGGIEPNIYAPPAFSPGSSYSHWDEVSFNETENALMTFAVGRGEVIHNPGPVALGFFEDMGWTLCQNALSTDEITLENIVISPNPFTETLTINLPSNLRNDNFNVSIVDLNGRVVINEEMNTRNGEISIPNLSSLESSLYFITVESLDSGLSFTNKIIKQ